MTNEELAVMIQNGQTEAVLPLWEQVELLCRQAGEQMGTGHGQPGRVEFEDLYQSGIHSYDESRSDL